VRFAKNVSNKKCLLAPAIEGEEQPYSTCTGAILSRRHILTAAHCLVSDCRSATALKAPYNFFAINETTVNIGNVIFNMTTPVTPVQFYLPDTLSLKCRGNDIAIIEIDPPMSKEFFDNGLANPVCLPAANSDLPKTFEAAGWGVNGQFHIYLLYQA
jgi:hypothetical protein